MECRIKTKKKIKLSKKQLNYQNNLALITKLPSLTLLPTNQGLGHQALRIFQPLTPLISPRTFENEF